MRKYLAVILLLIPIFIYSQEIPLDTRGIQAIFRLNENTGSTTADSIDTNGMTLYGGLDTTGWVTGKYGSALMFDGSNDITKVDTYQTNIMTDLWEHDFSISVWMCPNGTVDWKAVLSQGYDYTSGSHAGWSLNFESNNKLWLGGADGGWNGTYGMTNVTITNNGTTWTHVVITAKFLGRDGTYGKYDVVWYRNGDYVGTDSNVTESRTDDNLDNTCMFSLGARTETGTGVNAFFPGGIDDVGIANVVWTAEEVATIYGSGTPPAVKSDVIRRILSIK